MKTLKRWLFYFQMRSLEICIDGQSECLMCVSDPYITNRIVVAQLNARKELRRVRREYHALRNVSERDNWRMA